MIKIKEKKIWDNQVKFEGYDEETFTAMLGHSGKLGLVIEIGCGSGSWTKRLAKEADEVIGVDFSKELIKKMHHDLKKQNCQAILSDAEYLPFVGETADQCIFSFSLHHILNIDSVLQNSTRCLRKNGLLILLEPNGTNPIRYLGFRIGKLMNQARVVRIESSERPVNIGKTVRTLKNLGLSVQFYPCSPSIRTLLGSELSIIYRLYVSSLRIASFLFPDIFGSSDFILIGNKKPITGTAIMVN